MATRMARVLGRIDEFDPQREEIATYLERLQLYLIANEVAEDQQVAVLLVVVGSKVYDTLRSLVAPVKPSEKTLAELLELLQKHYAPKPLIIAERFRFYRCHSIFCRQDVLSRLHYILGHFVVGQDKLSRA